MTTGQFAISAAGQERLRRARVLMVGLGGLGCASAPYLARAGVGTLVVCDHDRVQESNLSRQTLYGSKDIGRLKVEVVNERLVNDGVQTEVVPLPIEIVPGNLPLLARGCDLIVEGTDNLSARESINHYAVSAEIPVVFGGAVGWNGFVACYSPGRPCFHCMWDGSESPTCSEVGVVGPVVGATGVLQAAEAIKLLLGVGESLVGRILLFDGLRATTRSIRIRRKESCPVCAIRT
ncbi:MAG: HesA/MoeB/ThiF family protein [Fimbriimonadaceae bacterium]|nr:HesA/MoeB/ThiF family protein [Fimbriimonadaceae bacterium]